MKTNSRNSIFRSIRRIGRRVIHWTAIGALLGGSAGALFGGIFGAFWILVHEDLWDIASLAGYFGLCGAVAGALMGAYATTVDRDALVEAEGSPVPESTFANFTRSFPVPNRPVGTIASSAAPLPRNRLMAVFDDEQRRKEALASQDPSQN